MNDKITFVINFPENVISCRVVLVYVESLIYVPRCEQTCMRTTKVQTSLRISLVCSAPLLFTMCKVSNPIFLYEMKSGLGVIKLVSCSTQLGLKFIMLLNVKMPTIAGI